MIKIGENAVPLMEEIRKKAPNKEFTSYFDSYFAVLPDGVDFASDKWNVIDWARNRANKRTCNVNFGVFKNNDLKSIVKIYICNRRFSLEIEASACKLMGPQSLKFLDAAVGNKPLFRINNGDFVNAEKKMVAELDRNTASRYAQAMKTFADWLASKLGMPVSYSPTISTVYKHGRAATDEDKANKLIPTECIMEVISKVSSELCSLRDTFYFNVFTLAVAGGFRVTELLTLPKSPIINTPELCLRYFPEKHNAIGIKPIADDIRPAVQAAVDWIEDFTQEGRRIAVSSDATKEIDWYLVYQDVDALIYFFEKHLHEWTSRIEHRVINASGAWYVKESRWIDVIKLKEECGSISAASKATGIARDTLTRMNQEQEMSLAGINPMSRKTTKGKVRTSFDTDTRFPSMQTFQDVSERFLTQSKRKILKPLLDRAQQLQAGGDVYPAPEFNKGYEEEYILSDRAVLCDPKSGQVLLKASDCLMVTAKNALSHSHATKGNAYSVVTDKRLCEWLGGTTRGRGSGGDEDSVFVRFNIIDPRTNEPLKLTIHDVRHWLNTLLNEGGATQEAIRLYFARKSQASNATYDQTSAATRVGRLKADIRNNKVFGVIQDNYNTMLAEFGRDEAEEYLRAKSTVLTIMPHGGCTLNWNRPSCDKYMSCFAGDEVCEDFCIDLNDESQLATVNKVKCEQEFMLTVIPKTSPQYSQVTKIVSNIKKLLQANVEGM